MSSAFLSTSVVCLSHARVYLAFVESFMMPPMMQTLMSEGAKFV